MPENIIQRIRYGLLKRKNLVRILSGRNSLKGLSKKEKARILRRQKESIYKPLPSFFS